MEITPKIRKLIYGMFDDMIEGADKYVTKSSMWLIFTEEKRWVIEFTNTKTLWFNYNLFQSELNLLSMDCVDSKDIIKEWFESRFLEKDIDHVTDTSNVPYSIVEDTIQNGVKHTYKKKITRLNEVEDTIQNGVKETIGTLRRTFLGVDDIIQNGVKDTGARHLRINRKVDDVIQNGVKEVKHKMAESYQQKDHMVTNAIITEDINYAIENGVKVIMSGSEWYHQDEVKDIIQNGVKS